MSDSAEELLGSRNLAALASKIHQLSDAIRIKTGAEPVKASALNVALPCYLHLLDGGRLLLETRPGLVSDNQEFAETVAWTVLSSMLAVCRICASQLGFDFIKDLDSIDDEMRRLSSGVSED